jgi:hypothetical protein
LEFNGQIHRSIVLTPTFGHRQSQIGIDQIQIDSRTAGVFKDLFGFVHIKNIASQKQRAKPEF